MFDPGDENKFAYTEVHNHYNKLVRYIRLLYDVTIYTQVDQLLTKFTDDLGITANQLADACVESRSLHTAYQVNFIIASLQLYQQ